MIRRRCGKAPRTIRSIASPRMSYAARSRTRPWAVGSTTRPAAIRESSRALASCTPRWWRVAALHETDYTPWEGHDIFAWPVVTILRGKVMVRNGQYFASPRDGQYLKRKISQKIRDGAAL